MMMNVFTKVAAATAGNIAKILVHGAHESFYFTHVKYNLVYAFHVETSFLHKR